MDSTHPSIIDRLSRQDAERRMEYAAVRCPVAERIVASNQPEPNLGGMVGMLQAFCNPLGSAYHKRAAASWLIYLRQNRIALRRMGRDPHAADETLLDRIAHHRRMAAYWLAKEQA